MSAEYAVWEDARSTKKKTKKLNLLEQKRRAIADKYDILYETNEGYDVTPPRVFATPAVATPRAGAKLFSPESPVGRAHSFRVTSTVPRKYCTVANAVLHFPFDDTNLRRVRNLDGVLNACMQDFSYRSEARKEYGHESAYAELSDEKAWVDAYKLYLWLTNEVRMLASHGANVGDFLDNLMYYENILREAKAHLYIHRATPQKFKPTAKGPPKSKSAIPFNLS